jgi:hypothetical protein
MDNLRASKVMVVLRQLHQGECCGCFSTNGPSYCFARVHEDAKGNLAVSAFIGHYQAGLKQW